MIKKYFLEILDYLKNVSTNHKVKNIGKQIAIFSLYAFSGALQGVGEFLYPSQPVPVACGFGLIVAIGALTIAPGFLGYCLSIILLTLS